MNLPAGSIKAEVNDALVGGIRQRGPDAVGLVIMGMARLLVGVLTLVVLLLTMTIFGYPISPLPFVGLTGVSALVSWLTTKEKQWMKTQHSDSDDGPSKPDSD